MRRNDKRRKREKMNTTVTEEILIGLIMIGVLFAIMFIVSIF